MRLKSSVETQPSANTTLWSRSGRSRYNAPLDDAARSMVARPMHVRQRACNARHNRNRNGACSTPLTHACRPSAMWPMPAHARPPMPAHAYRQRIHAERHLPMHSCAQRSAGGAYARRAFALLLDCPKRLATVEWSGFAQRAEVEEASFVRLTLSKKEKAGPSQPARPPARRAGLWPLGPRRPACAY
jgi:hypothetical protein